MSNAQQLSPEEKLLKVIQGGGDVPRDVVEKPAAAPTGSIPGREPSAGTQAASVDLEPPKVVSAPRSVPASAPAPQTPPSAPRPPRDVPETRPTESPAPARAVDQSKSSPGISKPAADRKQQITESISKGAATSKLRPPAPRPDIKPAARGGAAPAGKPATDAADAAKPAQPETPQPGRSAAAAAAQPPQQFSIQKKHGAKTFRLSTASMGLAAAILLVCCMMGYEIWAGIQAVQNAEREGIPKPAQKSGEKLGMIGEAQAYNPANVLKAYADRNIFTPSENEGGGDDGGKPPPVSKWMEYAKDNMKFVALLGTIGDASSKAVISDTKSQKMVYAKTGDPVHVDGVDVKVREIRSDMVILTDGVREQAVR